MNKTTSVILWVFAVGIVLVLTVGIVSAATVTQSMTYQGKVTDAAGNPLTGTESVTFNIYDVSTGGAALSTDTHSVTATNGLFTTSIAVTNPALVDGRALWLGIKVSADPEMTPRQEIRPVPYALSLRPGAIINGTGTSGTLTVNNNADWAIGLNVSTSGINTPAIKANTSNIQSNAIVGITNADGPAAIAGIAHGANSYGLYGVSDKSYGVYGLTSGTGSAAVYGKSTVPGSYGLYAETTNTGSPAVYGNSAQNVGVRGTGVTGVLGNGTNFGVFGESIGSSGVFGTSTNFVGVYGQSFSNEDPAVNGLNQVNGPGVQGYSNNGIGVYGQTGRTDNNYGIYTPDNVYIGGKIDLVGTVDPIIVEGFKADPTVTYEAGDVVCLAELGAVVPCVKANDTNVVGVVGPSVELKDGEITVVIMGYRSAKPREAEGVTRQVVRVKADAQYGAIQTGDLLTTSPTRGRAMKAQPVVIGDVVFHRPGTILGKALGSLESGTGTIEVFVTLQ